MYRIIKVDIDALADCYSNLFYQASGTRIPPSFFLGASTFAVVKNGSMVGGYCIKEGMLRSLLQIPESYAWERRGHMAELTGYWLSDKAAWMTLTAHMVINTLTHRARWFVYSYKTNQTGLSKHYAQGRPVVIYRGPVIPLEYAGDHSEESVEAITATGVLRIAVRSYLRSRRKARG